MSTEDAVKKLLGIKKFEVGAREIVYYAVVVEAESAEQALAMARDGEVDFPHSAIYDGDDFEITDAIEVE
jgi:hypothetical protein